MFNSKERKQINENCCFKSLDRVLCIISKLTYSAYLQVTELAAKSTNANIFVSIPNGTLTLNIKIIVLIL